MALCSFSFMSQISWWLSIHRLNALAMHRLIQKERLRPAASRFSSCSTMKLTQEPHALAYAKFLKYERALSMISACFWLSNRNSTHLAKAGPRVACVQYANAFLPWDASVTLSFHVLKAAVRPMRLHRVATF